MDDSRSDRTELSLSDARFAREPGLLGPLFEEAGTGERQIREALFLTFNVDLGFFEARLLGAVRATGAAVTVVADSGVFEPDPRNVRSAGYGYALGLAAMAGAFHPKLTILAGPQRALVGIGSGNLTIGGWHANDEVLTIIRADRDRGAPTILGEVVRFLRDLPARIVVSPLAQDGIERTAGQLEDLASTAPPVTTGHQLVDSLRGPILNQLPSEHVDELELTAPFHDLNGKALEALIARYQPRTLTVMAQPGQAVMDPDALERAASVANCTLRFVQLPGEDSTRTRYRHGKVLTAIRHGTPVWTLTGSANMSAAALLGRAPSGNCEVGIVVGVERSLLPTPTVPVADVPALLHKIAVVSEDITPRGSGVTPRLMEARAVEQGIEVILSSRAPEDLLVEVSPYAASPDEFKPIGVIGKGALAATLPGHFSAGSRVRVEGQLQFLAFPELVVKRLQPTGSGRPNHDSTVEEIFSSFVVAAQWRDALTRLLLTHGQAGRVAVRPPIGESTPSSPSTWRTLDDVDTWTEYAEDALARLGMPIFQLAVGASTTAKPVGASLPNTAPAWEDRFEETSEAFDEGETAESIEDHSTASEGASAADLSPQQRSRLRRWIYDIVGLMPQLGPVERIAVCQLAITGSSARIWDTPTGSTGWFEPLALALEGMNRADWPNAASSRAAAVTCVGLYRLRMAVPANERGTEATRFVTVARALEHLINTTDHQTVAENLDLLTGASFVAPSADDVVAEIQHAISASPQDALLRVLSRLLPELDVEWVGEQRLLLAGSVPNPRVAAIEALKHASAIPNLAVGVNGSNDAWVVIGRVPGRLTLVEGGKRPTMYRTYDTSHLLNPLMVLSDHQFAQTKRISSPPFTKPDDVDLAVLRALDVDPGPMNPDS